MTTGARRGELCDLRWSHLDIDSEMVSIQRTVYLDDRKQLQEKDTKTISSGAWYSIRKPPKC